MPSTPVDTPRVGHHLHEIAIAYAIATTLAFFPAYGLVAKVAHVKAKTSVVERRYVL